MDGCLQFTHFKKANCCNEGLTIFLNYFYRSSLIHQILISAFNEGIKFKVIVADGRPWLEGRELLKKLVNAGIQCTYVFVNGLSFVMPEVCTASHPRGGEILTITLLDLLYFVGYQNLTWCSCFIG